MSLQLPEAFEQKMRELLEEEFEAFMESYEQPKWQGLRVNRLKLEACDFQRMSPFSLTAIPWCAEGFYYADGERPGKHPFYHAGLYYIQEPSAMTPVEMLDVRPGHKVLDLCAAPGGKSTQIAAKLAGSGVLVSNDLHPERVKALVKNIEMAGVRNAVVLNEHPARIADSFGAYFDRILVDAPCSGEGMFRKDEDMVKHWSPQRVCDYAGMQEEILEAAAALLKPGGKLVYSTCTFSPEENEAMIASFLGQHPQFEVVPLSPTHGFQSGRPAWVTEKQTDQAEHGEQVGHAEHGEQAEQVGQAGQVSEPSEETGARQEAARLETAGTLRLWPHLVEGEGHYVALLQKMPDAQSIEQANTEVRTASVDSSYGTDRSGKDHGKGQGRPRKQEIRPLDTEERERWHAFASSVLDQTKTAESIGQTDKPLISWKQFVYECPVSPLLLSGLKAPRPGFFVGELKKQRFEPSQALAMGLRPEEVQQVISLDMADERVIKYLKGETIDISDFPHIQKGYGLICLGPYPLGWGKSMQGMLKNAYPAGWRWQ
ncbi:RsmB/NOP family class I SAM-dependent RNA methyltransferase [Marinicrinis sediminis]|uniref:RsmB/NOP family class I SAM-dependent RNA methyltransferase n=1 Tax=Marinicrinis sediminis TaxID=1652465 RepID=A0ABW5R9V2_9BACL